MMTRRLPRVRLIAGFLLFLLLLWTSLGTSASGATQNTLTAYFLDVGQGDATLLLGPDFTILIDAGRHDQSEVVDLLRAAGVERIDLFILTHPHSDHIGQCDAVMTSFPVEEVWMSGDVHTSLTFERCIDAILATDAYYHEPRAGEQFQIGSARIEVVHPARVSGEFNNGSIGLRLTYGDVTFLFTGDAETEAEAEILGRGHDIAAQILHLGHHGSRTSSTLAFLRAVSPEVAIYSAGQGNVYGHPHEEVLMRLASLGVTVYGTDRHGTIRVETDGSTYTLRTERDGPVFSEQGQARQIPDACLPGQININSASEDELMQITGIGQVLAGRIIDERPFLTLDDLLRVSGIGQARLAQIKAQGLACAGPYADASK